jgi:hypothetical protein
MRPPTAGLPARARLIDRRLGDETGLQQGFGAFEFLSCELFLGGRGADRVARRSLRGTGRFDLGPGLGAAARVQAGGAGRLDQGDDLAGGHNIAGLQGDAAQVAGNRRGDGVTLTYPGPTFLVDRDDERAARDGRNLHRHRTGIEAVADGGQQGDCEQ